MRSSHSSWVRRSSTSNPDERPYAQVEPGQSRATWYITVNHGVMQWGPDGGPFWHLGTRLGAERRARRLLKRYIRTLVAAERPTSRIDLKEHEPHRWE